MATETGSTSYLHADSDSWLAIFFLFPVAAYVSDQGTRIELDNEVVPVLHVLLLSLAAMEPYLQVLRHTVDKPE